MWNIPGQGRAKTPRLILGSKDLELGGRIDFGCWMLGGQERESFTVRCLQDIGSLQDRMADLLQFAKSGRAGLVACERGTYGSVSVAQKKFPVTVMDMSVTLERAAGRGDNDFGRTSGQVLEVVRSRTRP